GPAPVEDRTVSAAAAPSRTAGDAVDGGLAWVRARAPGRYTLQLVGARDRAAVDAFVRVHRVAQPYAIFERQLNGRPWYSLVAGDYPSRDAAVAARGRLPKALARSDIWPRTFASVQEIIK
ncbi:MAG: SPOR domain-containing protein, partial [Gammaproteobacteria bacterium]|nr:SPOR domain-containing protein [Gammaproteobacteria bacterium]